MSDNCKLDKMFELREKFMRHLAEKNKNVIQIWPVDINEKKSQQTVRDTFLKGVEEIFECISNFRNWKNHRVTEITTFDKNSFLEEYVDALNYFFAALVMMGITPQELFDMYVKKDRVIHSRIDNGY